MSIDGSMRYLQGCHRGQKRRLIVLEIPCTDFETEDDWLICNGRVVVVIDAHQ